MADKPVPPAYCQNPWTVNPWWIVAYMLVMPTLKFSHPVLLFIGMESNYRPLHDLPVCNIKLTYISTQHLPFTH